MMKKYLTMFMLAWLFTTTLFSQQLPLGPLSSFQEALQQRTAAAARGPVSLDLATPDGVLQATVVHHEQDARGLYVVGSLKQLAGSEFYIRIEGSNLRGHVLMPNRDKAYQYTTDAQGNAVIAVTDVDKVLCVRYEALEEKSAGQQSRTAAIVVPILESYPGANGCVLLDFDGQVVTGTPWNNGQTITAAEANLTTAQIQEIWEMISEDFRPFHLNITTNEAVFNTYPKNRRMRCIFTPTNTAAPGAGGVAYLNSFNWNDDTPCWVFNGGVKGAGEAGSHEVGHTFGLAHDGRTSPSEGYFAGHGDWAPIMGVGYYEPISQWSKGEYTNANNTEDDLAKISSATFGVGYKADEAGGTLATAAALAVNAQGTVSGTGLIGRTGDVDMYAFTTAGGAVTLNANVATRHPDLDVLLTLYNASGTAVATASPTTLSASISTTLSQGTYYLAVTGTGRGNPASDGYSNYASLGYYSLSGTVPPNTTSGVATFYKNCSFSTSGYAIGLGTGNYTTAQLVAAGIANNDISSLRVQSGYEVVLYKNDNFGGAYIGITSDVSCLTDFTFNDSTSSLRVRTVSNQLPTVSFTSPAAGSVFTAPAAITLSATASDADGSISKVEFFNGTTKLGEDLTAPYSFTWSGVAAGSYTLVARATDDRGGQSSVQVSVSVTSVVATVYKDCNYLGYAVGLAPGSYTLAQLNALGVANDDISSLKVTPGYEVVLWQNNNFSGSGYIFRNDFSCLVSVLLSGGATVNLNDWTSSLVVQASTAAAATSASAIRVEEEVALALSPNPADHQLTVRWGAGQEQLAVYIQSAQGQQVLPVQRVYSGGTVDVSALQPGLYLVTVVSEAGRRTTRLVKR